MGNGRQRVVVVTRRLDVGGTERHLLAVLPRLDRSRIEVRVLVLRAGGSLDAAMQSAGVPIVAPPLGWHGWGGLLLSAMRLRSEEHTSELRSLMRISYAVFCLKKKNNHTSQYTTTANLL